MADGLLPDVSFGEDAERASAAYDLAIPVEKSLVVDWDGAEKLWKHAIGLSGFRSSRIIVTTGVLAPKATRERLVRTCAAMGFADVHCGVAPVLALFGAGYTTGCVVDCGLESSRVVPVYDGYALPHAIVVDPSLGGLSVDAHAARILETAGLAFRNNEAALRAGEVLKIRAATVGIPEAGTTVELPLKCLAASSRHRQVVEIGVDERAAMGETLFVPQVANRSIESPGLAGVVLAAVTKCSIDLRRAMYEGIFLVGGGSLIPGLPERLDVDLNHLAAANVDVQVTALENRKFAAFLGASVVADLPDFASNWISREDAEDDVALAARLDQTSYNC
ncbi:hypothetical protein CTAYLR_003790 [Chrysophaeum taylorii]|uniref:Actin n=1 Tax=Chrysophaeum taylorii TaxID=2483200 RepID=A0AAD7UCW8_9STRA|nr:hypothetical protein CTAYLR_003790 [Chrysophaeum taylorii]